MIYHSDTHQIIQYYGSRALSRVLSQISIEVSTIPGCSVSISSSGAALLYSVEEAGKRGLSCGDIPHIEIRKLGDASDGSVLAAFVYAGVYADTKEDIEQIIRMREQGA